MSDLKICRICLCKGVKVYHYNDYHLKQYYEEVLGNKVNYKDGLPHYFCYVCAAMLFKFYKFKEKCRMGQDTLKDLMRNGPLTLTSISQINRQNKNLRCTIDIINVSKRVKTYCFNNNTPSISPMNEATNSTGTTNNANIKTETVIKSITIKNLKDEVDKISEDKKSLSDHEVDRHLSENENLYSTCVDDLSNSGDKEIESSDQTIVSNDKVKKNTETVNNTEKDTNENHKDKMRKRREDSKDLIEEKRSKFAHVTKKNHLDPNYWLKVILSEEEVEKEFRARAQDPKYLSASFKCTGCCKGYSTADILNRHIKLRHCKSLGPFECRFCNMRFKRQSLLTRHLTQHYTRYKCLRCDLTCPVENTAVAHNEFHNGVIRKCMHCGEEFRHRSTYNTHLRTHRSEHVCTLCGASFISKMGLQQHKRVKHVIIEINPEIETNTYCVRCDIRFGTRKAYEEHLVHSAMHAEDFEDLGKETTAPTIKRGRKMFLRNPRKVTSCTICNKTFASETAYMRHHNAEHTDCPLPSKQRHICEICGASLAIYSIASHLNTHTREKPYTCATCGTQFKDKSTLTRHQLTHTGEKPYECSLCDKRFTQSGSMKLHYRTFHLKEPYPKRNRRKNTGDSQEMPLLEDYRLEELSKKN